MYNVMSDFSGARRASEGVTLVVQVILTSCKVLRMVMLIGIQLHSICIYIYTLAYLYVCCVTRINLVILHIFMYNVISDLDNIYMHIYRMSPYSNCIQFAYIYIYIYVSIFICMLCYKDQLGDFTYIYV